VSAYVIRHSVAGGLFGFALAMAGITLTDWRFWVLMVLFAINGVWSQVKP
jgi:hypothetical protein